MSRKYRLRGDLLAAAIVLVAVAAAIASLRAGAGPLIAAGRALCVAFALAVAGVGLKRAVIQAIRISKEKAATGEAAEASGA